MVSHPYSPYNLELPDYTPNLLSSSQIVLIYVASCILLCIIVGLATSDVRGAEKLVMYWLSITGVTHIVLEAYYVFTPSFISVDCPMFLAEVWKEYSKADSRYASRDSTVIAVEVVLSLFDGSASLFAMYAIAMKKPYKHPLILVISVTDICMFAIYFLTAWLEGNMYHASSYYFWFYYVTLNSLYGVWIPGLIGLRSWKAIVGAMDAKLKKE